MNRGWVSIPLPPPLFIIPHSTSPQYSWFRSGLARSAPAPSSKLVGQEGIYWVDPQCATPRREDFFNRVQCTFFPPSCVFARFFAPSQFAFIRYIACSTQFLQCKVSASVRNPRTDNDWQCVCVFLFFRVPFPRAGLTLDGSTQNENNLQDIL